MNGGGGRTVLVVDDDAAIRRVVRSVLEADGFAVVEAADGPTALGLLEPDGGYRPDALVLDVMMPGIDGVEVCRALAPDRPRVIMLSARHDAETRRRAEAAGADFYLTKPFSAVELLEAVEGLPA